jgi:hypothetical protein
VGVSLEALSAKPVALAPVGATVKAGVHTSPFLATKRGGYSPRLEENIPLKRQKDGCYPASLSWLFVSVKRSIWLILTV